jgi:hypothetical protein
MTSATASQRLFYQPLLLYLRLLGFGLACRLQQLRHVHELHCDQSARKPSSQANARKIPYCDCCERRRKPLATSTTITALAPRREQVDETFLDRPLASD